MGNNQEAVSSLVNLVTGSSSEYIYLWGSASVGKSHLLQACCQHAHSLQLPSFYLPLGDCQQFAPQILENLDNFFIVCIDNIQMIAGIKVWEEALFHLFNQSRQNRSRLVIAGNDNIKRLAFSLPDLESRLASGITYHLKPLTDAQKLAALQLRAQNRGLELNSDVGQYLLNHFPRNLQALIWMS